MSKYTLNTITSNIFSNHNKRDFFLSEVANHAELLIKSYAFCRLKKITLLGALSPLYFNKLNQKPPFPESLLHNVKQRDGSRLEHSIDVAIITNQLCKHLMLPIHVQKYAIFWALLHDIATWPLSHTGEVAFSKITSMSTSDLRKKIILGAPDIPASFSVYNILKESNIDPKKILDLLDNNTDKLDPAMCRLANIIHSPMTPDTLAGMYICGRIFNIDVPYPLDLIKSFTPGLFEIGIKREFSDQVLSFWRRKAEIYKKYINRKKVVIWESNCSLAIEKAFSNLSLEESLNISEDELIRFINENGIEKKNEVFKYKYPLKYYVSPKRKKKMPETDLVSMSSFLRKEPIIKETH